MKIEERPPWIIRTYAGFADASATNARYRANLARGQRGLSIAFDLPTQNGFDSDHAMSAGEVGGTGVAVCNIDDMGRLLDGIPLEAINTSMTINAPAPWLFALYLALAEEKDVRWDRLRGTTQNDLMKEFVARGTHIFDPETSLRLTTDLIEFAAEKVPQWNPMNACGYHYMESGATPAQEIGFAMGNALLVLDRLVGKVSEEAFETIVRRISFFVNSGIELVGEIAKFRAYAQLWPALCQEEYGLEGVRFRAGCQVRSLTLTAQQPELNIVRIALQALPAVMSADARVRALQLPGFREAIGLPNEAEQTLALRTQQVLMYETDLAEHLDIFEGSVVIEAKTRDLKREVRGIIERMRGLGYAGSIDWISEELTAALVQWQSDIESGERVMVGVNAFEEPVGILEETSEGVAAHSTRDMTAHLRRLANWRNQRNADQIARAMLALSRAFEEGTNIMPASVALARAGGTTGEWTQTLLEASGGRFRSPLGVDGAKGITMDVPHVTQASRVLIAKSGLDGHINAVKLLAVACARAGFEVIYTGLQQTPDAIVSAALEEDVDLIAVSSLSGAHRHIATELILSLREREARDIPVVMGGIIPQEDHAFLHALGIEAVFTPGAQTLPAIIQAFIELTEGTPA